MGGRKRGWCNHPAGDQGQQPDGEKWSYSCHIVKVEPKGFAEGSGAGSERKEWGGKDDSQVFG